jgi:hypothetical protein
LLAGVGCLAPVDMMRVRRSADTGRCGVETVAVHPKDSSLVVADQYGFVHRAVPTKSKSTSSGVPKSSYKLKNEKPIYLGPSRPLGLMYDHQGQLIVCDAIKVPVEVVSSDRAGTVLECRSTQAGLNIVFAFACSDLSPLHDPREPADAHRTCLPPTCTCAMLGMSLGSWPGHRRAWSACKPQAHRWRRIDPLPRPVGSPVRVVTASRAPPRACCRSTLKTEP